MIPRGVRAWRWRCRVGYTRCFGKRRWMGWRAESAVRVVKEEDGGRMVYGLTFCRRFVVVVLTRLLLCGRRSARRVHRAVVAVVAVVAWV